MSVEQLYNFGFNKNKQTYIRPTEFEVVTEIIRPANTTAYAANSIINNNGASNLPALNFSSSGIEGVKPIQINSITIMSSNGLAVNKLLPIIHLTIQDTITSQTLTDGTAFNPTYDNFKNVRQMTFENCTNTICHGSGFYLLGQTEMMRNCIITTDSKLYVALITSTAYTPSSAEKFNIVMKGYSL